MNWISNEMSRWRSNWHWTSFAIGWIDGRNHGAFTIHLGFVSIQRWWYQP